MAALEQIDIAGSQHEVQRLLGQCLLRLQQYERLLKAMIAAQAFSGTPEAFPRTLDTRKAEVARKTLGMLIGCLMGDYIRKESGDVPDDMPDHESESVYLSIQIQLNLPDEGYESLKADLGALVTMRNKLVHHFIEMHDLWTVQGCLRAQTELHYAYAEIDRHFGQLCTFAGYMDETKRAFSELVQSPQFGDWLVNGIAPDGQVHWPMAGIVAALMQAFRELSVDGWVEVQTAARWVAENQPEQTPQKYGCSRWRHVIRESRQFELRRFTHNGHAGTWFRPASEARKAGSVVGFG